MLSLTFMTIFLRFWCCLTQLLSRWISILWPQKRKNSLSWPTPCLLGSSFMKCSLKFWVSVSVNTLETGWIGLMEVLSWYLSLSSCNQFWCQEELRDCQDLKQLECLELSECSESSDCWELSNLCRQLLVWCKDPTVLSSISQLWCSSSSSFSLCWVCRPSEVSSRMIQRALHQTTSTISQLVSSQSSRCLLWRIGKQYFMLQWETITWTSSWQVASTSLGSSSVTSSCSICSWLFYSTLSLRKMMMTSMSSN